MRMRMTVDARSVSRRGASMRTTGTLALTVIATLLLASVGLAQNPDATQPSAAAPTLYAHHNDDGEVDDEYAGYMNADADDPDSDDVAMGASYSCTAVEQQIGGEFVLTWTLELAPPLVEPIELNKEGMVRFVVHFGSSSGSAEGVDLSTSLTQGQTIIAQGESQIVSYGPAGEGQYAEFSWTVPPIDATINVEEPLIWTIEATGPACAGTGMFVSVSEARGRTRIELPLGAAATPNGLGSEEVSGDVVRVDRSFGEPTTGALSVGWNTSADAVTMRIAADVSNGSFSYNATDGAGFEFASGVVDASTDGVEHDASGLAPGNWTFGFLFEGFNGTMSLDVGPPGQPSVPPGGGNETMPPGNGTGGPAGNGTENGNATGEGADSPGVGAAALVALTAVAAFRRSRRPRT